MHYICTGGCEGVAMKPGVCMDSDCVKKGEPLEDCECVDNLHGGSAPESSESFEEPEIKKEDDQQ